jgi:hypothetical protein
LEAAIVTLWLADVEGNDRSARIVAVIEETVRAMKRLPTMAGVDDQGVRADKQSIEALEAIIADRRAQLVAGTVVPGIPSREELASEVGGAALHELYVLGSQFVHSTQLTVAAQPTLAGDGGDDSASWALLLKMCWEASRAAFNTLANLAPVPSPPRAEDLDKAVEVALTRFLDG